MKKDQKEPPGQLPQANPNPVFTSGPDGVPRYLNPAALRLCRNLKLKSIEDILPDTHRDLVRICLQTGKSRKDEHTVDGRTLAWSYVPVDGNRMIFIYGHDITRYRSNTTLEDLHDILVRLYSLTPAEVKLTELLVDGKTLKMAGEDLGIAISTARSQLRNIFRKTRTGRQSELIRQVFLVVAAQGTNQDS